jgi:chemotaxis protein methyltransferase CheR
MVGHVPDAEWEKLSDLVADRLGLHFPRERRDDLRRGVAGAADEYGFEDVARCVRSLLAAPPTKEQIEVLASHLTIGETYFFREPQTLSALAKNVLPELIASRRGRQRRLRLWSAACCTGEEPYSLAILLHQILPDLRDWHVTITATDINLRFLQKAAAGIYGEWSFRSTSAEIRERYFKPVGKARYEIAPEIKSLVRFGQLNLVEDVYPSLETSTNAMDVVFCRNVLMYFTADQVRRVIDKLRNSLVEGAYLVVSPAEASKSLFPRFIVANFPGAIFFRKHDARDDAAPPGTRLHDTFSTPARTEWQASPERFAGESASPRTPEPSQPVLAISTAESLYDEGRYAEVVSYLRNLSGSTQFGAEAFSLMVRALANEGRLTDALAWCDRWVAADKIHATSHYLRAVILTEQGDAAEARAALQRAIFLDPDFVLAHFALGNIARGAGRAAEARKHYTNTLELLQRFPADEPLPESEGITAGRLMETVSAIVQSEEQR